MVDLPDGTYIGHWYSYQVTVEPKDVNTQKYVFSTQDGSMKEVPVIIKVASKSAYIEAKI